jgi:hypothetical protein
MQVLKGGDELREPRDPDRRNRGVAILGNRTSSDRGERGRSPAVSADRLQFYAHLVSTVERGQQSGDLTSEVSAFDAATSIFGSYFISLFLWHRMGRQGSLVEMVDGAVRLVTRGLRP